ncbi:MAG: RagB/SusD family nutrient uptake outer membrane protein [Muribaculum sp.]|nr:RagB/SusD family nutrient uptake outer membrane protein [Muribaculaceae bacterium]MCM1081262.1 RagB/SusD family nutrient uptake outer membrane protein [Muribaculum sp.]
MKLNIKHLPIIGMLGLALSMGSCTDKVAFGNAFLEKAPGGAATADTVFHNPEYTRGFLAAIYSRQFYGLPSVSSSNIAQHLNYWHGNADGLTDIHQNVYAASNLYSQYYQGMLSASSGNPVYPYNGEELWEMVRRCWLLIERVNEVPNMEQSEKDRLRDEAKCLLASFYFTAFRYYGGMPILRAAFVGSESSYSEGRSTVQETADFMLGLIDEVQAANALPWAYTGADALSQTGHWTMAGARALKIQILQFLASPLFNSERPYYEASGYTMEKPEYVWLGGYDASRWTTLKNECADFLSKIESEGSYGLTEPLGDTFEDYRFAFRQGYLLEDSKEVLHSVRISSYTQGNDYNWYNLGWPGGNERVELSPTQEYVEMFPWADGTPFDWDKTEAEGKLDEMFFKGEKVQGQRMMGNRTLTRDPRLYESCAVNGALVGLVLEDGTSSGEPWEAYIGGQHASTNPSVENPIWSTGYRNLKYLVGECFRRKQPQWSWLQLSDVYLTYAEAILQSGGTIADAMVPVDKVRARVGLGKMSVCAPEKIATRDGALEEIMRERCCEFALQETRYYDMVRYKRADLFTKKLHGLRIYRLDDSGNRINHSWYSQEQTQITDPNNPLYYEPTHFEYEKFEVDKWKRVWWSQDASSFDVKWYLCPFPISEINKGYGLVQNPGW